MALWPGLPQLWFQGRWSGLFLATAFAWTLLTACLATFLWPLWLSPWLVRAIWSGMFLGGGISAVYAVQNGPRILGLHPNNAQADEALVQAQVLYLQGDYFDAEKQLQRIFAAGHQDIEAALLMISILRRTGRYKQALFGIERLSLVERSQRWAQELARERQLIGEHGSPGGA
jgi:hypothetical protein